LTDQLSSSVLVSPIVAAYVNYLHVVDSEVSVNSFGALRQR